MSGRATVTNARYSSNGSLISNGSISTASLQFGENVVMRMAPSGVLELNYQNPGLFSEIVGKAGETTLFRIGADGTAFF
jgi:hypothetical protein